MKVQITLAVTLMSAACATSNSPRTIELTETSPGVFVVMRGTDRDFNDVQKLSAAMLIAGDYCAALDQAPELILSEEGGLKQLAFRCEPGETWPPGR